MSMELHVLSDRRFSSIAEWQRAIDIEKYPLRLAPDIQFATLQGLLPATLDGKQTGFECYHDDATGTMKFLGNEHFEHRWAFALGFRWRGDFDELEAAWMAATAYAAGTGGAIFDHEEGKIFTPEQARTLIVKLVSDRPRLDAAMEEIKRKIAAGS